MENNETLNALASAIDKVVADKVAEATKDSVNLKTLFDTIKSGELGYDDAEELLEALSEGYKVLFGDVACKDGFVCIDGDVDGHDTITINGKDFIKVDDIDSTFVKDNCGSSVIDDILEDEDAIRWDDVTQDDIECHCGNDMLCSITKSYIENNL